MSFKLDEERTVAKENLFTIVAGGTVEEAEEILDKYPDLINEREKSSNFFAHIMDSGNKTLLLKAIQHHALNDNSEMIEFLIDRGADVNASNGTKPVYPIIEILWRGSEDRYEIAWLMIEKGADITVEQDYWNVPYAIVSSKIENENNALQEQSLEIMKFIVEQDRSLLECENSLYGMTSLIGTSSRNNYTLITKYFIDNGIYNINRIVANDGSTSLIQAVHGDSYDTCKLLIEYGADVSIVDDNGKTAYDYAVESGNQQIIGLFSEEKNSNSDEKSDDELPYVI